MVSENSFVVSENSGKIQGIFVILMGGNPDNTVNILYIYNVAKYFHF